MPPRLAWGRGYFYELTRVAVPVFMFISFYLTNDIYHNGDIGRYRKRLIRLEIPWIVWNLIYALIVILEGKCISASDLFGGLIWGMEQGLIPHFGFCPVRY